LVVAIIGYRSVAVSVLVWGWERKIKIPGIAKYCVPLPYTQSTCRAAVKYDFSYNKRCGAALKDDFSLKKRCL
jgi:hypothetical protein